MSTTESNIVTATTNELIATLGVLHRRIDDGFTYLITHDEQHAGYSAACRHWWALTQDYIMRITEAQKRIAAHDLDALVTAYAARLERGWQMEPTERVVDAFSVVLNQYMALCDLRGEINVTWYLTQQPRLELLNRIGEIANGGIS